MSFRRFLEALKAWFQSLFSRPAQPPEDPVHPVNPVQKYSLEHVWTGPPSTYKLVGLLGTPHGLLCTTCNVYRGSHRSKIFGDGKEIYSGSQETIGQPFMCGDAAIFPVEHGSHHLIWDRRGIHPGGQTHGRWSVAGGAYRGYHLLAYNNAYASRRMLDEPVLVNVLTGRVHARLSVRSMPRCLVEHNRELYVSHNFGTPGITVLNGPTWQCNIVQIASFNGRLYGGESAAWGPAPSASNAGGLIYQISPAGTMVPVFDTGCACVVHMAVLQGRLWIAGIDPDRLWVVDQDERPVMAAELPGETPSDLARSFGGAVAEYNGRIYWGRSDARLPHVYEVIPQ